MGNGGGPEGIDIPVRVRRADLDREFDQAERRVNKERKEREKKEKGFRFALLGGVIGGAVGVIAAGVVQKGGMQALGPLLEMAFSLFLITMLPFIRTMLPFMVETLAPFIMETLWPFFMNKLFPVMLGFLKFLKEDEKFFVDPDRPGSGKSLGQAGGLTLDDVNQIGQSGSVGSQYTSADEHEEAMQEFGEFEVPRMAKDEDFENPLGGLLDGD